LGMLQSILWQPDAARQLKYAETDPDLDCIHDDPRFEKIMLDAKKHLGMAALPPTSTAA
jgi:hypothetical protein